MHRSIGPHSGRCQICYRSQSQNSFCMSCTPCMVTFPGVELCILSPPCLRLFVSPRFMVLLSSVPKRPGRQEKPPGRQDKARRPGRNSLQARCGGNIRLSPPPAHCCTEDLAMVGLWRYREAGSGLGYGEYISERPWNRMMSSHLIFIQCNTKSIFLNI
jgi:hypothetical protein